MLPRPAHREVELGELFDLRKCGGEVWGSPIATRGVAGTRLDRVGISTPTRRRLHHHGRLPQPRTL